MSVKGRFEDLVRQVCQVRRENGEMPGQLFVVIDLAADKALLIPENLPTPEDRAVFMAGLRDFTCADGIGMISEAWVAVQEMDSDNRIRPSERSDREEAIIATLFEGDKEPVAWIAKISPTGEVADPESAGMNIRGTIRDIYEGTTTIPQA